MRISQSRTVKRTRYQRRLEPGFLLMFLTVVLVASLAPSRAYSSDSICPVTLPQQERVGLSGRLDSDSLQTYVNPAIFVFRPGPTGFIAVSDGGLGMKFGWNRKAPGLLAIEGRRLDDEAEPLRVHMSPSHMEIGFQASTLIFPEPGCWEITGKLGGDRLTFVVLVMKIGDGPDNHADR